MLNLTWASTGNLVDGWWLLRLPHCEWLTPRLLCQLYLDYQAEKKEWLGLKMWRWCVKFEVEDSNRFNQNTFNETGKSPHELNQESYVSITSLNTKLKFAIFLLGRGHNADKCGESPWERSKTFWVGRQSWLIIFSSWTSFSSASFVNMDSASYNVHVYFSRFVQKGRAIIFRCLII